MQPSADSSAENTVDKKIKTRSRSPTKSTCRAHTKQEQRDSFCLCSQRRLMKYAAGHCEPKENEKLCMFMRCRDNPPSLINCLRLWRAGSLLPRPPPESKQRSRSKRRARRSEACCGKETAHPRSETPLGGASPCTRCPRPRSCEANAERFCGGEQAVHSAFCRCDITGVRAEPNEHALQKGESPRAVYCKLCEGFGACDVRLHGNNTLGPPATNPIRGKELAIPHEGRCSAPR